MRLPAFLLTGLGAAATLALTGIAGTAVAQGWRERPAWEDGPGYWRPRPRYERYDDPYEYEPPVARRPGWRWTDRGWTRTPRADTHWEDWGEDAPRRAPRVYRPDDWQEGLDDQDGGSGNGKVTGVDGGSRPYIAPRAPSIVPFAAGATYPVNSIVIDTGARRLYFVRNAMSAFAYPIGVGREGFAWTGREKVSRIADWPDWYPPAEMRKRKPELPERMLGGLKNPLGAKAIYLGNTLYRIHGTNDPKSIGRAESSGCFRMMNEHVLHLASLVNVGTQVAVVRSLQSIPQTVSAKSGSPVVQPRAPQPPRMRWSDDPNSAYANPNDYDTR